MNANIVLSVKNREVLFNPHSVLLKWTISLPIERIEVICDNSHYIESVSYPLKKKLLVRIICDKWNLPKCDKVVLPLINNVILTNQLYNALFSKCHSVFTAPIVEIEQYIKSLREGEH